MPRIPMLSRDEMDDDQKRVYDATKAATGRVGRGPSIGYAYAPGLWETNNATSAYFESDPRCSLTPEQLRIAALITVRHWNAAYPWTAQARMGLGAGMDAAAVEAINERKRPKFASAEDNAVYEVAHELLETGTVSDKTFESAKSTLGYRRLADVVGVVGHFCKTAMMANVAGAEPPADAPSHLKK